jgi:agmatinase
MVRVFTALKEWCTRTSEKPREEYNSAMAGVSILGVPNDDNSSFLKGAAEAPANIRRELWSEAGNLWTETRVDLGVEGRLRDCGDVRFNGTADPWDQIERRAEEVLRDGNPVIFLGGDHAITHPLLRAVRRHHSPLTILHFDAHPDIYHDFQGNPRSHASPFARIMEERLAGRLIQVGIRTATGHQRHQIERFSVELIEAKNCRDDLRMEFTTPVYISLDIDGIDPAYAPGVSHREPGGLSPRQVINLIHSINQPVIGADIVEYNPRCDVSNLTANLAAKLVKEIAGIMVKTS